MRKRRKEEYRNSVETKYYSTRKEIRWDYGGRKGNES
jgi:hypothetical protein